LKVLVVEDDEGLRRLLNLELTHYGYEVKTSGKGIDALRMYRDFCPDIVLLDILLPQLDGFELLVAFREIFPGAGIIILSVINDKESKLKAFRLGVDDYVTKPFDMEELLARIEALARRAFLHERVKNNERLSDISSRIEIDDKSRTLRSGEIEVRLSSLEFRIFKILYSNTGTVVEKDQIIAVLWGQERAPSESTIPVYIKYLREKLEPLKIKIETVRGVGYVLKVEG
jgi:DNA-binding response OmpR family regulator